MNEEHPEDAAVDELSQRVHRWRMGIVSVAVVVGVVVGIAGYWLFRAAQIEKNGAHAPWLTGGVTFAAGVAVMALGWLMARLFIRARRPAWVREIAARHRVGQEELNDIADTIA